MQQASLTKCLSKTFLFVALPLVSLTPAQNPQPTPPNPKSLQLPLSTLQSAATFQLSGQPDLLAISEDAVWVSNGPLKAVQRIAADTNEFTRKIDFPAGPCSGLVFAFGTLWVPRCGDQPAIARVSPTTNKITAILPSAPPTTKAVSPQRRFHLACLRQARRASSHRSRHQHGPPEDRGAARLRQPALRRWRRLGQLRPTPARRARSFCLSPAFRPAAPPRFLL
jgi:hypothetical protein